MDILNNKSDLFSDDSKMEIIIQIYPYLYDAQNIERLVKTILNKTKQGHIRGILHKMQNYYFEIKGEANERISCCCFIF